MTPRWWFMNAMPGKAEQAPCVFWCVCWETFTGPQDCGIQCLGIQCPTFLTFFFCIDIYHRKTPLIIVCYLYIIRLNMLHIADSLQISKIKTFEAFKASSDWGRRLSQGIIGGMLWILWPDKRHMPTRKSGTLVNLVI